MNVCLKFHNTLIFKGLKLRPWGGGFRRGLLPPIFAATEGEENYRHKLLRQYLPTNLTNWTPQTIKPEEAFTLGVKASSVIMVCNFLQK